MRVLALTRYDDLGSTSRVRVLQYVPRLAVMGLSVTVQPLFSNASLARLYRTGTRSPADLTAALTTRLWTLLRHTDADVIWLQQEVFPFLPAVCEALLLSGRPFVVDFDDATHLTYQNHASAFVRALYGDKIAALMRRAAAVVVGSDVMADYARAAGARAVHLVYSAVDTQRFAATPPPQDAFRVGWIGTPMTAAQSLHIVREPLRRFLADTGATCLFVGMAADQFSDLPGRRIPWSEATETEFLADISVGLCPLDDSPWTRGKSGYKVIQYMAAGRATLASPVGIAARLVEDGVTGFHCRTEDDWYVRLMELYRDRARCAALGQRARGRAVAHYDTQIAAQLLHGILIAAAEP